MNKVTDLLAKVNAHKGFAKANRFKVLVEPPRRLEIVSDKPEIVSDKPFLEYTAESATLPGRTIATVDHQDAFETRKMPYTFIDDEVVVGFVLSNDYHAKKVFDEWQNKVFDDKKYKLGYKDQYKGTVKIWQIGKDGESKIYGVELVNAFPIISSAVELSDANENAVSRFTVTFAYDRFITL